MKNYQQEAKELRIALALQGIASDDQACERIITTYEEMKLKGDQFNIADATELSGKLDNLFAQRRIELKATSEEES